MPLHLRIAPHARLSLMGQVKLGQILAMPESEFQKWLRALEEDPWFQKLAYPPAGSQKVIRFQRFSGTSWHYEALELHEERLSATVGSAPDIRPFLEKHEDIFPLIRRIGEATFRRDYLYGESEQGVEEMAKRDGLSRKEAERILLFVKEFDLQVEASLIGASQVPSRGMPRTFSYPIAHIEREGDSLSVAYHSLSFARGRYHIDYERLKTLEERVALQARERKQVRSLLKKLEIVNWRKQILNRALLELLIRQRDFLLSGRWEKRSPLSQRQLAGTLKVNSGVLNRVLGRKSVVLPDGKTLPFDSLFLKRKEWLKERLAALASQLSGRCSDETLRRKLFEQTGLSIPRRSLRDYRKELGLFER